MIRARSPVKTSAEPGSNLGDAKLGLYLAPASEVEGAGSQGVVVVNVDPSGVAADKGLQQGDVILDAGGKDGVEAERPQRRRQ